MTLTTRHMIDQVTVWEYTEGQNDPSDPFAAPTDGSWSRNVLPCEFEVGGKTQTDREGATFEPATTLYTATRINRGASVMVGDIPDAEPPPSAELVRKEGGGTSLSFQGGNFVSWTG